MKATQYNDTHVQALAYAEADRSDPFTYSRIISHIASGVCDDKDHGEDARYKAERHVSENGRVYFTNVQRP